MGANWATVWLSPFSAACMMRSYSLSNRSRGVMVLMSGARPCRSAAAGVDVARVAHVGDRGAGAPDLPHHQEQRDHDPADAATIQAVRSRAAVPAPARGGRAAAMAEAGSRRERRLAGGTATTLRPALRIWQQKRPVSREPQAAQTWAGAAGSGGVGVMGTQS